jgi:predicted nuclease of restriction endonuclease-like RecB superfamily
MLEQTESWALVAEVRWGKDRKPLSFRMQSDRKGAAPVQDVPLPDEVTALLEGFRKLASPWFATPCQQIFEVKGQGLVIPDLEVVRGTKRAFIEVLGHWSRDAVFRRIDMVRTGLPAPVLFAVGAHLRVSEQLLDDVMPGSLYVYKRTMSARAICAKLDALTGP